VEHIRVIKSGIGISKVVLDDGGLSSTRGSNIENTLLDSLVKFKEVLLTFRTTLLIPMPDLMTLMCSTLK
jgi:hypothetical protein